MVLGYNRYLLRAPRHVLYDRMRTGVSGENGTREVRYNCSLLGLLNHYGLIRAPVGRIGLRTKGKVEHLYSFLRQDF